MYFEHEMICRICGSDSMDTDIRDGREVALCANCGHTANFYIDQKYAIGGTGTSYFFRWHGRALVQTYIENTVVDTLLAATESCRHLSQREQRPFRLLPIVKQYYDCLATRTQDLLVRHPDGVADPTLRDKIEHNPPNARFQLKSFIDFTLTEAFPLHRTKLTQHFKSYDALVSELLWIRNKREHVSLSLWPLPSFIHNDFRILPDVVSPRVLNVDFLIEVNHFVVDSLILLIEVSASNPGPEQFISLQSAKL